MYFWVITDISGTTKFEEQHLLVNKGVNSGTGLQGFDSLFDPAEWTGFTVAYYHELNVYDSGANYDADAKLQEDPEGTPADITGSTVTDIIQRERSSAMTMPGSASDVDTNITSFATFCRKPDVLNL